MKLVHDDEVGGVVMSLVRLIKGLYQLVFTIGALCLKAVANASPHHPGRGRV